MNSIPKPKRERDEQYLAWIRTQPCCLWNPKCNQPAEPHHVREKGKGGMGTKPSDRRTVPLCRGAHDVYHEIGREEFEAAECVDLEAIILRLNREYDKLNKKPRRLKAVSVKLKSFRVDCNCRDRKHDIPRAKGRIKIEPAGVSDRITLEFLCVTTNTRKEVSL